jgi:hypothetical protein
LVKQPQDLARDATIRAGRNGDRPPVPLGLLGRVVWATVPATLDVPLKPPIERQLARPAKELTVGAQSFPAETHAAVLIYPNPLNPKHYVVLNSGFTFREYDYLNNARQVPKLPDWAIVDVTTPPSSRWPGKIAAADFFTDLWQVAK